MADKYSTAELIGVVMTQDNGGNYLPKEQPLTSADFHSWRIGKHTKGKLGKPGQLFLTENNLVVMLVDVKKLAFKDRHDISPMGRFMTAVVASDVLADVLNAYK